MSGGMILELDVGNSSTKWRLLRAGRRLRGGRVADLAELLPLLPEEVAMARIASVAGSEKDEALERLLRAVGIAPNFAKTQAHQCGVRNSYREFERMGVDRWLAMLAAFQHAEGACVVIDAGSALTVDLLETNGDHCGGYIIPGTPLLRKVWAGTGRVRFAEAEMLGVRPGRNTEECVQHGMWVAVLGAIKYALSLADEKWPVGYEVFICGGDAAAVIGLMGSTGAAWHHRNELVMDGLRLALPLGLENY